MKGPAMSIGATSGTVMMVTPKGERSSMASWAGAARVFVLTSACLALGWPCEAQTPVNGSVTFDDGSNAPAGTRCLVRGFNVGFPIYWGLLGPDFVSNGPISFVDIPCPGNWNGLGNPIGDPIEVTFSPVSYTFIPTLPATLQDWSMAFYITTSGTTATCTSSGCGNLELKMYSRWGTLKGRIMFSDGTPAADLPVTVTDLRGTFQPRATATNAQGYYDFTKTLLAELIGPDTPYFLGDRSPGFLTLPAGNKWGIPVEGDGTGPGKRTWRVQIANVSQDQVIRSNEAAEIDVILPVEEVVKTNGGGDDPDERGTRRIIELVPPAEDEEAEKVAPPSGGPSCVGHPVSVLTGNVFLDQTDSILSGLRQPLALTRSYNSKRANRQQSGLFGRGWTHSFESRMYQLTGSILKLTGEDGVAIYFEDPDGDQTYTAMLPKAERTTITRTAEGFVRHFPRGGHETYDLQGRLIRRTDELGNTVTIAYDGSGELVSVTDPNGRAFSFQRTLERTLILTGPGGTIATYEFSGLGLSAVKYADGTGYRFHYDLGGQLLSMTDLQGRVLEKHEYADGRALTSELADGREKLTLTYEEDRTVVSNALGHVATYEWSKQGGSKRVTRLTGCSACGGGGGETQSWTYDASGRPTSSTNGLNQSTSYIYDASGNVSSVTDALNQVTRFSYNGEARLLTRNNPDGSSVSFAYGPAGPTSTTATVSPGVERTTTVGYDALGRVTSRTDGRGKTWTFAYRAFGDVTGVTDPLSHTTAFGYDSTGRRTSIADAIGRTTTVAYDVLGRVTRVTDGEGKASDVEYDGHGRRSKVKDPLGRTTGFTYDLYGRLETQVDASGSATRYGYDLMSKLTSLTDAKGETTSFEYDSFSRLTKVTYPEGGSETLTYDAAGRRATRTDRRGITTTYSYDNLGRVLGRTYSNGEPAVTFNYDPLGRLAAAASAVDTLSWTYDLAGQLVSEHSSRAGTTISHTYDEAGNPTALGLGGSPLIGHSVDDASRLTSIARGSSVFTFSYDPADQRIGLVMPNGVSTTYSYDLASRLVSVIATTGSTTVASHSYAYDDAGTRTQKTTPAFSEDYLYDDASRLTGINRTGSMVGVSRYGYDRVGNRLLSQSDSAISTSSYNSRNQLSSVAAGGSLTIRGQVNEASSVKVNGQPARVLPGNLFEAELNATAGTNPFTVEAKDASGNTRTSTFEVDVPSAAATFTYDSNGNMASRSEAGVSTTYGWDAENRLKRVVRDGSEIARFAYDPLGRRVEKTTTSGTISYVYDGFDILQEISPVGSFVYIHGTGIDEPLARQDGSGALLYYHADGLGSIVKMTDQAGSVTQTRQYDAWGNLEVSADQPGYGFTGREWDPETGLYYYRARYYDPKIGRFLSEDPIGFQGGVNFYEYVFSNPANWVDAYGLDVLVALREGAQGFGHIGIGVNQLTDTAGFYSSKPGLDVLMGKSVPGVVRPDESKMIDSMIIKTTPEQDKIIQDLIDRITRNPPDYNLDTNNCAIEARDILAAGGVKVPDPTKYPRDFFKELKKMYGPKKK